VSAYQPAYRGKPKPVTLPGYEEFHFYGVRQSDPQAPDTEQRVWCVYEETTGLAGSWGDTLEAAATWTKFFLDLYGGAGYLRQKIGTSEQTGQGALF
jgi:hypothetical protein